MAHAVESIVRDGIPIQWFRNYLKKGGVKVFKQTLPYFFTHAVFTEIVIAINNLIVRKVGNSQNWPVSEAEFSEHLLEQFRWSLKASPHLL